MAEIVPTILATTLAEYHDRLEQIKPFATRIHVDISDGDFTPTKTINLAHVYVPEGVELDLHLMVKDPFSHLESALALKPRLVIIHTEAEGNHQYCIAELQSFGVDAGIALLPESTVEENAELLKKADHALIFTGDLGHNGGTLDATQLHKLQEVKTLNEEIETSVDGGVNTENAAAIDADVLFVGSAYMLMVS